VSQLSANLPTLLLAFAVAMTSHDGLLIAILIFITCSIVYPVRHCPFNHCVFVGFGFLLLRSLSLSACCAVPMLLRLPDAFVRRRRLIVLFSFLSSSYIRYSPIPCCHCWVIVFFFLTGFPHPYGDTKSTFLLVSIVTVTAC